MGQVGCFLQWKRYLPSVRTVGSFLEIQLTCHMIRREVMKKRYSLFTPTRTYMPASSFSFSETCKTGRLFGVDRNVDMMLANVECSVLNTSWYHVGKRFMKQPCSTLCLCPLRTHWLLELSCRILSTVLFFWNGWLLRGTQRSYLQLGRHWGWKFFLIAFDIPASSGPRLLACLIQIVSILLSKRTH